MLPSRSGILAEAIGIASFSTTTSPSLCYCNVRISEAIVLNCSVKKMFLKILPSPQVFPLAQELPVNFDILKNTFLRRTSPVAASGIYINRTSSLGMNIFSFFLW